MSTQKRIAISLSVVILAILSFSYIAQNLQTNSTTNPSKFSPASLGLIPPPAYALNDPNDPDFGIPLYTANIGLFAYYYRASGFNLTASIPSFTSYTSHGNYLDGYQVVWEDASGNTYVGSDTSITISIRLRADGWVLAWMNTTQNRAYEVYWAQYRGYTPYIYPISNATTPSRAIQRIFYVEGLSFPGYPAIKLYDYQYPTATRLLIFGSRGIYSTGSGGSASWYATIPSATNTQILLATTSIGAYQSSGGYYGRCTFAVNGVTKFTCGDAIPTGWTAVDITSSLSFDSTITFTITLGGYIAQINAAIILYLR